MDQGNNDVAHIFILPEVIFTIVLVYVTFLNLYVNCHTFNLHMLVTWLTLQKFLLTFGKENLYDMIYFAQIIKI